MYKYIQYTLSSAIYNVQWRIHFPPVSATGNTSAYRMYIHVYMYMYVYVSVYVYLIHGLQ